MKLKKILTTCFISTIVGGVSFSSLVNAADSDFPKRNITTVIPFQPGDTDSMLRPFVDRLQEFLGQSVTFDYKPGAGGGIGAAYVASRKPDGYTMVGTSPGSIVVVPVANKKMTYTYDSFSPVAALAEGILMIVAPASSKWETLQDLVDDAKHNPDKFTYASSGAMGITHLLGEAFVNEADIELTHVPYQGSGPAIAALLGDHVDISVTAVAPAQGYIKSGDITPLAIFSDERMDAYPDVPTLKELGFNVGSPTYYGLLVPKDTPKERVDIIYDAIKKVDEKYGDDIAQKLSNYGAQKTILGPEEYGDYLNGQNELFSEVVKIMEEGDKK